MPIHVNIICGPLGSGKTTLVRHLLKQKPQNEQWALLVNEFGSVGIDGAILSETGNVLVKQMPGGCICCSAQADLQQAVQQLLTKHRPHRLIIEPTGLGEPDTLVDLFKQPELQANFQVQSVISILDTATTDIQELKTLTIMQSLLTMADVIVLNKQDLASEAQKLTLADYCNQLYPPKTALLKTQNGEINLDYLTEKHIFTPSFTFQPMTTLNQTHLIQPHPHQSHQHDPIDTQLPYTPETSELKGVQERHYKKQLGIVSIGWIFNAEVEFNWKSLQTLFETFKNQAHKKPPGLAIFSPDVVKRAKGVFKVGRPRMLFQFTPPTISREYIAYRKDSRLELLLQINTPHDFDFTQFEQALAHCQK